MKCENCGTQIKEEDKFCYNCGKRLATSETNGTVRLWLIPIVLIVLFMLSILDLPYGFYAILRLVVFYLSLWFALLNYLAKGDLSFSSIFSVVIAIIWNPFIPVHLDKEVWVNLDIIAIIVELIMLISSYILCKKHEM